MLVKKQGNVAGLHSLSILADIFLGERVVTGTTSPGVKYMTFVVRPCQTMAATLDKEMLSRLTSMQP